MARASWDQASKGDADASPFPEACVARRVCVVLAACLALVRCHAQSSAKCADLASRGPTTWTGTSLQILIGVHLHWDMLSPAGNSQQSQTPWQAVLGLVGLIQAGPVQTQCCCSCLHGLS